MKGKTMIDRSRRVYVYYNLHRKIWSVRQSGNRVEHHKNICLHDVRYLVQPAGRKRVIKSGVKNVHAGLSGYVVDSVPVPAISFDVTYNPFKHKTFVDTIDHEPQEWSEYAYLSSGKDWKNVEAIFSTEYFSEKTKVSA
jgi:hypothetical protein